ncbi:MAG: DUF2461 domain-containing protein [Acidimicrobiia bacterium]|nr:DUF2461 domain-containing protein [Acidimicrobiia bacterium]
MATRYFTAGTFDFLRDLAANNSRAWFNDNKARYEASIKEPALDFIEDFATPLEKISRHFVADPSLQGGSLFRIHRDTRFSKDKTPYKTNTGLHFRHFMAKDAHAPGFYLHLEPGECFMGVGLWRPETSVAYAIRRHIDEHPADWKKATRSKRFTDVYSLQGDSLTRPPKGFDEEHPLIEDLKRKDFIASARLSQKTVTSADFATVFEENCKRGVPLMKFLCDAVGVPF